MPVLKKEMSRTEREQQQVTCAEKSLELGSEEKRLGDTGKQATVQAATTCANEISIGKTEDSPGPTPRDGSATTLEETQHCQERGRKNY